MFTERENNKIGNATLINVYEKVLIKSQKSRLSANKRWGKHNKPAKASRQQMRSHVPTHVPRQCNGNANQTPHIHSSISSFNSEEKEKIDYSIPALPDIAGFKDAFMAWHEHRRAKKAKPTRRAMELAIKELLKRPENAVEMLGVCVLRNWTGIKWEWFDQHKERGGNGQSATRPQPLTVRIAPTPTMSRIGNWFHRRDDEPWAEEEAGLLASLNPPDDELDTMGRYYTDECVESSKRRQSVSALLRAWQTELDKARCWLTSQGELL
jgi:hypothetical protein